MANISKLPDGSIVITDGDTVISISGPRAKALAKGLVSYLAPTEDAELKVRLPIYDAAGAPLEAAVGMSVRELQKTPRKARDRAFHRAMVAARALAAAKGLPFPFPHIGQ